jgi:hypothetical protein
LVNKVTKHREVSAKTSGRSDVNISDGSQVMGGVMARRFPYPVAYLDPSFFPFFPNLFSCAILNFILRKITFSVLKTLQFLRTEKVNPFEFLESEAQ